MTRINGEQIHWWRPLLGKREKELLCSVIDTGFLNDGPLTTLFEEKIAAICGVRHAVAVTSGTVAMFLSLAALGIGVGDEVIVPDITFIATANAVKLAGATPVLVDVDPSTFCVRPQDIESAITSRSKAIIPVHISGRSAPMSGILEVAQKYKLRVIEDAAEAFGSFRDGNALGTFGDTGCFSFTANKTITTGQGGAIVTKDSKIHQSLRELKDQGRQVRGTGGDDVHASVGYNFKFTDLQAAIGLAQIEDFENRRKHLRHVFKLYQEHLRQNEKMRLPGFNIEAGECPQWVDYWVHDRDGLHDYLLERKIHTRKFWHPIHTQEPYRKIDEGFSNSVSVSRHSLWLPSALDLTDPEIRTVCREINQWSESRMQ
jgi:perosamine synthetase